MASEEEIEKERKSYESDTIWTARKAFLMAHWKEYPRNQLDCYSQLFINVNMIGCVYSPSLMMKIKEMGDGIMEKANKLNNERQFVYASRGRAEAEQVRIKDEISREQEKKARSVDNGIIERIRLLRHHMMQAAQTAKPGELINMCERVQLRWFIDCCSDGETVLRIRNLIAFKYRFTNIKNSRNEVISTVTDSFIHCEPSISEKNDVIMFNDVTPEKLYVNALQRRLIMAARHLGQHNGFEALKQVFSAVGIDLIQTGEQLQGWSQRMDIRGGELLVARKELSKNECVKQKLQIAVDEMCKPICEAIRFGTLKIRDSEKDGLAVDI